MIADSPAPAVNVPIVVTGSGNVGKVVVKVRANHTFVGDVEFSLVHPDGTVVLLSDNRGGSGDNFGTGANDCSGTKTVFDDGAATAIAAGTAPFAGTFRPDGALSALNGKPIAGTWNIRVQDTAATDFGTLFCADIEVYGLECCTGGGGNTAPGITALGPLARVAGAAGTVSPLATVTDVQDAPGTLTVTQIAGGTATGITTTAITNTAGAITANVAAACAATSGTVRFQVTDSGALSSTADLTVNVTGGVNTTITAPASACQNATGLAASVPAGPMGTTYTWTINNGGTITGGQGTNAITFSVAAATPVQLGVTVVSGGCNGSSTKNVVVNAPPSATITAPAAVCAASTGNPASGPNAGMGATYVWTATGGTITGGQGTNAITFTATAAAPGPVALGVTVTASGCNGTGNVNVPVTALPTAPTITGNTNLCVGGGLTLTASAGYTSYLWSKDGNPIVGQTAQTYTKSGLVAGDAGLYRVQGVLSGCTSADSAPTTVVVSGTCPAPTVTVVSPICAGMVGGKDITITGTGFQPGATVKLIGTTATNVVVVSSTQITCKAGARAAGAALQGDVLVTNPDAQFGKLVDGFFYAVRGDANNNGSVTGADSFYLNQAIFLGGPAPATLCNGDANSSNATTGADSFFLNLFIFLGGPPPGP
ncbi:MAG: proprotein convertase P-domain-containing protein [Acidobacteria bacterium]|nr:proprotein convertase P-domain-containing protein [Acidobacteriota bacterium]